MVLRDKLENEYKRARSNISIMEKFNDDYKRSDRNLYRLIKVLMELHVLSIKKEDYEMQDLISDCMNELEVK